MITCVTDLTPLFNWNTKQLFLYLEAEYVNTEGVSESAAMLLALYSSFQTRCITKS